MSSVAMLVCDENHKCTSLPLHIYVKHGQKNYSYFLVSCRIVLCLKDPLRVGYQLKTHDTQGVVDFRWNFFLRSQNSATLKQNCSMSSMETCTSQLINRNTLTFLLYLLTIGGQRRWAFAFSGSLLCLVVLSYWLRLVYWVIIDCVLLFISYAK